MISRQIRDIAIPIEEVYDLGRQNWVVFFDPIWVRTFIIIF